MKIAINALVMTILLTGVPAQAIEVKNPSEFVVEVKGIVCSFCAYGARKNLARVDFLDRKMFKEGLLMETDKGTITAAIAKGKKIDFAKVSKAITKGGYEILAVHLNLTGMVSKKDGIVTIKHQYNGQEFILLGQEDQPWAAAGYEGKETAIQGMISGQALAKMKLGQGAPVRVKSARLIESRKGPSPSP